MVDSLTDAHYDWATQFTGIPTRPDSDAGTDASAAPNDPNATPPDPATAPQSADPGQANGSAGGDGADPQPVNLSNANAAAPYTFSPLAPQTGLTKDQLDDIRDHGGILTPEQRGAISKGVADGPPPTVSRQNVEAELTKFFTKLQATQKGSSVRVTDTVRHVGRTLAEGLPDADTKIDALLSAKDVNFKPADLAHKIAAALPDTIPQANFDKFTAIAPTEIAPAGGQSLSDAFAKIFDKDVSAAVSFLPKAVQDAIKKGVADALAGAGTALVKQAMANSQLDPKYQTAITNAIEAFLKTKDKGPPMDRKQDTSGSPDAPPVPPATPPQGPPPPGVPGEQIIKTPAIAIPDTPTPAKPADPPAS